MREENFYAQNTGNCKGTLKRFSVFALFLFSALLTGFSLRANNLPSFVNGYSQVFSVCQNSTATSINAVMAINDADVGDTESWTVLAAPLHGTLSGFPTAATSTGGALLPAGLTYTPATGYFGNDTFTIQIFDGLDTATTNVIVNVKTLPTLSSGLTPPSICTGSLFSYVPTSATSGATFSWSRPFLGGISNPAATGTGNPLETLISLTYYNIAVTYNYTITGNGCTNHQNVVVTVKPTPTLTSALADTICSGAIFSYIPKSPNTGATFTWSRAAVAGIAPGATTGTGNVTEALVNNTLSTLTAIYNFTIDDGGGCTGTANVSVDVHPQPAITAIVTAPGHSLCAGTNYQTFGAGIAPPTGVTYSWTATNAVIKATGKSGQYSIINFPNPGLAVVTLNCKISGSGCLSTDTFAVNVGNSVSISDKILFYNAQFIYLDNDVTSFQWGYDAAGSLAPTVITGATFQSYPNTSPDFGNKYYWVTTSKNGCTQKTYYNAPLALANVPARSTVTMHVYPNPVENILSVDADGVQGAMDIAVTDVAGRTLRLQTGGTHGQQLNVAGLQAGYYIVNCYQDGIKIATAGIVKN